MTFWDFDHLLPELDESPRVDFTLKPSNVTALFTARTLNSGPERQNRRGFPNQTNILLRSRETNKNPTPRHRAATYISRVLGYIGHLGPVHALFRPNRRLAAQVQARNLSSVILKFWSELPISSKLHSVANTAAFTSPSSRRHVTLRLPLAFLSPTHFVPLLRSLGSPILLANRTEPTQTISRC